MTNIFKIMRRLLNRPREFRHNQAILDKLRAANPSCKILSIPVNNVSMGEYVAILDNVYLTQVSLGNFSYVSSKSRLFSVDIGSFCSIGRQVQIGLWPHPSRVFVSAYPAFYSDHNDGCPLKFREDKIFDDSVRQTDIGNDVWIGANAIIPGGIKIGTGAIIAAGSVVVKDVPPYAVVGGNPAKVIRLRFPEEQINILLDSEWWNWPIEKILQNVNNFSDINKFRKLLID